MMKSMLVSLVLAVAAPSAWSGGSNEAPAAGEVKEAEVPKDAPAPVPKQSFAGSFPAPEFPADLEWINVSAPLTLASLRGKVVLLDFWTYGCINCIHNIPYIKALLEEFKSELVVIGVHSAKFENEGRGDNIRSIVRRYGIDLPAGARALLESGRGETVKPGDPRLAAVETHLVATPQMALEAAAGVARAAGVTPVLLGDSIEGEARDVGKVMAAIALQVKRHGQPVVAPCVLLSGGETTVTVRGNGRGGRNVEFLLALAVALDGAAGIHAVAGDTDGVDGLEEIAGALVAPDTLARAWAKGIRPRDSLDNNDGHGFFEALGDSLVTGPTLTNVNDFRAILIV